jgi:hypothetical protein
MTSTVAIYNSDASSAPTLPDKIKNSSSISDDSINISIDNQSNSSHNLPQTSHASTKSQTSATSMFPHCFTAFCVAVFDIANGPTITHCSPSGSLTPVELQRCAALAFPDSHNNCLSDDQTTNHHHEFLMTATSDSANQQNNINSTSISSTDASSPDSKNSGSTTTTAQSQSTSNNTQQRRLAPGALSHQRYCFRIRRSADVHSFLTAHCTFLSIKDDHSTVNRGIQQQSIIVIAAETKSKHNETIELSPNDAQSASTLSLLPQLCDAVSDSIASEYMSQNCDVDAQIVLDEAVSQIEVEFILFC